MSDHALPPDPASWPRDPFRLLGVRPGVSSRDLRKAYLRLIRSYKPEHSPEEFQKIRQAYESILPFAERLDRASEVPEIGPEPPFSPPLDDPPNVRSAPNDHRSEAAIDPWDLACRGEPEPAYRALLARQEGPRAWEDDYLQLYWLLSLLPALDPDRPPVDWLVRGLRASGADAPRLRELLRRELAAAPALALGESLEVFFRKRTPTALTIDYAEARWRASREAGQWGRIVSDVETLRDWVPEADEAAWVRLLIAASTQLAWAIGHEAGHSRLLSREVEQLGNRHRDHADELYQLEYIQMVKSGLDRLGGVEGANSRIGRLLALSWDEPGPEFRERLRGYVVQVAQGPNVALRRLDEIQAKAPAVLGRLSGLLGGFEFENFGFFESNRQAEVTPVLERFLESHPWSDYPALRPSLLKFCLREAISPGLVARTITERPEFILTGKVPLAHAINEDWPLRHAYRACELARETPDGG